MEVPTNKIDGKTWLILKSVLGKKVTFRACSIKHKGRVRDSPDDRVDEADADGSVKCRSKHYDISGFTVLKRG